MDAEESSTIDDLLSELAAVGWWGTAPTADGGEPGTALDGEAQGGEPNGGLPATEPDMRLGLRPENGLRSQLCPTDGDSAVRARISSPATFANRTKRKSVTCVFEL